MDRNHKQQNGIMTGCPHWMAPEVIEQKRYYEKLTCGAWITRSLFLIANNGTPSVRRPGIGPGSILPFLKLYDVKGHLRTHLRPGTVGAVCNMTVVARNEWTKDGKGQSLLEYLVSLADTDFLLGWDR